MRSPKNTLSWVTTIVLIFFGLTVRAQAFPLVFDPASATQMMITEAPAGTFSIVTAGNDPKVRTIALGPGSYDPDSVYVISFDYLADEGLDEFQIYYGLPISGARSVLFGSLPPASSYRTFRGFMKFESPGWNAAYTDFRFDFGISAGQEITVRNLQLRAPTAAEVIPLRLDPSTASPFLSLAEPTLGDYEITTSGGDPYVGTEIITTVYDADSVYVLSFDYTSTSGLNDFSIFYGEPSPTRRLDYGPLAAAANPVTFTTLLNVDAAPNWDEFYDRFRFDFGTMAGLDIQVSNLTLRAPTNAEEKFAPVFVDTVRIELNPNFTSGFLDAVQDAVSTYTLTTVGPDPWIRSLPVTESYETDSLTVLEFEYMASAEYNELQLFYGPPINGAFSLITPPIPAVGEWTTYTIDTRLENENFTEGRWTDFRFDFGRLESPTVSKTFAIRNIILRKPTADENTAFNQSDKIRSRRDNEDFLAYLSADYPDLIVTVEVERNEVIIGGRLGPSAAALGEGSALSQNARFLVEILPEEYGFNLDTFTTILPITDGASFEMMVGRYVDLVEDGVTRQRDRLYSRWAVATQAGNGRYALASYLRWPTRLVEVAANNQIEDKADALKGLEGLKTDNTDMFFDLEDLGVSAHRIGLLLHGLYRQDTTEMKFRFNGKTYGVNPNFINGLDIRVRLLTAESMKTSLTILCPLNNVPPIINEIFTHPDARTGLYSMANVTSALGVEHYTAYVDFLARRYSRPDSLYGRVDQFIIHNEADAHTEWTHAGEKPVDLYTQIYDRSMRLVYLTARKHNPTFKVFSSHTKHFNSKPGSEENFKGLDILNRLTDLSKKEGDYEWGIAWHAYPTNLTDPRVWNDPIGQTRLDLLTPQITPRNLEMIDVFVRQKDRLYNGKKVRTVMLSENGFNSNPALPGGSETNQAAAVAYFWKKAVGKRLPAVETIHLQRWVDFPTAQGILFGLWTTAPNTSGEFDTKKQSWQVWADAGTANEAATFDPYLTTIGISDWSAIQFDVATETTPYPVTMSIACPGELERLRVSYNGEEKIPQSDGTLQFFNVASNVPQPYEISRDGEVLLSGRLDVVAPLDTTLQLCALPVNWLSFAADARHKSVALKWETSFQADNAGFELQHSATGVHWDLLASVAALPASSGQTYSYEDTSPLAGANYYRVLQTDFDGQGTYSPVRLVQFDGEFSSLIISPNPSAGYVSLILPEGFDAPRYEIIDAAGKVTGLDVPHGSIRLDLTGLAAGAYVLRAISENGSVVSGKLVLR